MHLIMSYVSFSVWLTGHQSHSTLENFAIGPASYTKWCLMYGQMRNFYYFPFGLVHWLAQLWQLVKFH